MRIPGIIEQLERYRFGLKFPQSDPTVTNPIPVPRLRRTASGHSVDKLRRRSSARGIDLIEATPVPFVCQAYMLADDAIYGTNASVLRCRPISFPFLYASDRQVISVALSSP